MEVYLPPNKQLSRTITAKPSSTNEDDDALSAWLASQMHSAGRYVAQDKANTDVEASAINDLVFHHSIQMGDVIRCYAEVISIYRTLFTIHVEACLKQEHESENIKVAEGTFIFHIKEVPAIAAALPLQTALSN